MSLIREYNLTETDIENRLGDSALFDSERLFEIKAVYRNNGNDNWKLCSALIHSVNDDSSEFSEEYKEAAFFTTLKKFTTVSEILTCLFEGGIQIDENYPPIEIDENRLWEESLIPSVTAETHAPIRHFLYRLESCNYSDSMLVGYGLPFYPSITDRVREFIGYENSDRHHIHLLIDDSRAVFKVKDLNVIFESSCDVHVSGQIKRIHGIEAVAPDVFENSVVDLSDAEEVELWAVDQNNVALDYISTTAFPYKYELQKNNQPLEEYLKEKVTNGETIDCEFKKYIDLGKADKKAEEIDRSVCALSNTEGGYLIIGVADNGDVLGVEEQVRTKYKMPIDEALKEYSNALRKRLYENLTINDCFVVSDVEIFSHRLVVVHVAKSTMWNMFQSTHVPYIRKGSTNYNATRLVALELDSRNRDNLEMFR